jgi:cell division protease FtsH
MRQLRALAASAKPLAASFIDLIRARGGSFARSRTAHPETEGDDQLPLNLETNDDLDRTPVSVEPVLSPADATAAALLGRGFEGSRDVLARLRAPDMVAVIEVPTADLVRPVLRVLRHFVLGSEKVLDGTQLEGLSPAPEPGVAILFKAVDDAKRGAAAHDSDVAAAVQIRASIIGITADRGRLPRTLLDLAEHRIVLPAIDANVVSDVIEAVTGKRPDLIDDEVARGVTIEALSIAVRTDLGARRSLARLQRLVGSDSKVSTGPLLSEMHGLGPAKAIGLEIVAALRAYAAGELAWADCPKGLLISGPPGTAKTTFARALCREASVNFVASSYAQWQSHGEGHLGDVTRAIRNTFKLQRGIIFIDEIDAIPARGRSDHGDSWFTAIVACLLECLDGFARREGVFEMAACNDPSRLDPALIRAGRLDQHVKIPLPDVPGLIGIFRTYLREDLADVDLRAVALAARGHTGADAERWVRIARKEARDAGRPLDLQDLLDAVHEGKSKLSPETRRLIAYHEAGHAIAHWVLGTAELTSLSIGTDGGLTESDLGALHAPTRAQLENFLVVMLAGRAAEQLVFNEVTAGSAGSPGSDLERANRLAIQLEAGFGWGALGPISISETLTGRDLLLFEPLRASVRRTLERAQEKALAVLARNRAALDALAKALFDASDLDREEIEAVLAPFARDQIPVGAKLDFVHHEHDMASAGPVAEIEPRSPAAEDRP